MRKILCTAALALALCGNTLAGEIPTPPVAPPNNAVATQEPTEGGELSTTSADTLTQMALDLLVAMSALF